MINRLLKFGQRKGLMFWRKRAIEAAKNWMLARFQKSDGLGAIFPPVVFSTVALKALGYADHSPEVVECLRQLERLAIDDPSDGTTRLQPCFSPVWDTGLVMRALAVAGVPADDPAIVRAAAVVAEPPDDGAGRLGRNGRCRARRLVLRICQRVLSRTSTTRPCR